MSLGACLSDQKAVVTITRSPHTIGLDWLWSGLPACVVAGRGAFQTTFLPVEPSHTSGNRELLYPMPEGPRKPGQSSACAPPASSSHTETNTTSRIRTPCLSEGGAILRQRRPFVHNLVLITFAMEIFEVDPDSQA